MIHPNLVKTIGFGVRCTAVKIHVEITIKFASSLINHVLCPNLHWLFNFMVLGFKPETARPDHIKNSREEFYSMQKLTNKTGHVTF